MSQKLSDNAEDNQYSPFKMKREGTFVVPSLNKNSDTYKTSTRLLVASNRAKYSAQIEKIKKPDVEIVVYQYEGSTLDLIKDEISTLLKENKAECIGFLFHGTEKELFVANGKVLSVKSITEDESIQLFFHSIIKKHLDKESLNYHVDILGCTLANEKIDAISEEMKKLLEVLSVKSITEDESIQLFFHSIIKKHLDKESLNYHVDILGCTLANEKIDAISEEMKKLLECPVLISRDLHGSDTSVSLLKDNEIKDVSIGEIYFDIIKLKDMLINSSQNLTGYEKIRTVGKGAFGTAVLYKKKDDDSLVILKEINMHDLTAAERQLAINEINVLSMLDHPNIVCYYDNFEQDGILMIELEYADGGTLAQYLGQLKRPLGEHEILILFQQIVSAICHMHEHNILHRQIPPDIVVIFSARSAKTMLQCEGKPYNEKSDIWALGCILYEMACLQKTFEGSNLPALVNKIVKGQFAPVRGNYSLGFKKLIQELLQRDPEYRPTAKELLNARIPELLKQFEKFSHKYDDENEELSIRSKFPIKSSSNKNILKQPRTVLYQVKMHEMDISLTPILLPPQSRIKEVALSTTHTIALTYDLLAYTWGDGRKGQLGHGMLEIWRHKPQCVDALKGKNIIKVCAGEGFSVFTCDNGIVMTCGDGSLGCLGHGDLSNCLKPKLIEKLLSVDVSTVCCGPHHVVVVGGDGEAFAWGCGNGGRLGIGKEDDCCSPTPVQLADDIFVKSVYCGINGTMFVTETGSVLACGRNDYNKLGLNEPSGFLMQMKHLMIKTEVEKQLVPTRLRWLHRRVVSISMGATHTAILVEPGHIIMFGCNQYGQLGRGNVRKNSSPSVVKSMQDKVVTMVQCGNSYTVASTIENTVYFWGGRQVTSTPSRTESIDLSLEKDPVSQSFKTYRSYYNEKSKNDLEYENSVISDCSISEVIKIGKSNSPLMTELERIGPDSSIIQVRTPESRLSDSLSSSQLTSRRHSDADYPKAEFTPGKKEAVLQPQEILVLYASSAQITRGETVTLSNIYCHANHLYLAVNTTAPIPKKKSNRNNVLSNSNISKNAFKINKHNLPEEDSIGPVPEWLKEELANAILPGITMDNISVPRQENTFDSSNKLHNNQNIDVAMIKNKSGSTPKHKTSEHFDNIDDRNKSLNYSFSVNSINEVKETHLRKELEQLIEDKKVTEGKLKHLEEELIEQNKTYAQSEEKFKEREMILQEEIMNLRQQLNQQNNSLEEYHSQMKQLQVSYLFIYLINI
ncbi:uncharacterized protein LOC111612447 [Centruroides sculpturatus]|uniref:uncharacterized protein LOC111612447 n=1 Tax=Centruroides sculpturatus TaxID=218467 RepID=UPI000C6D92A9|nr:uncharacterized protein LOC111612447 [Centruroides sculpturatus]